MKLADLIVLLCIAALLALAVYLSRRRKKTGSCCGSCQSCPACTQSQTQRQKTEPR